MVKKIVLIVFFSIFVCVFIAFNYLLIQKESADIGTIEVEKEMTARAATISYQDDKIVELEGRTSDLLEQVATLREQGEEKDTAIAGFEVEALERDEIISQREDLINKLKQNLDVDLVGQQAREWLEYMNNGDYEKSYVRFNRAIDNAYSTMILSEFRAYYSRQVGMVEIKSLDVMTRGIPETIENDLIIAVVVDLITPRSLELFYESLDERRAVAEAEAEAEAARRAAEEAKERLEQIREAAERRNEEGDQAGAEGDVSANEEAGTPANGEAGTPAGSEVESSVGGEAKTPENGETETPAGGDHSDAVVANSGDNASGEDAGSGNSTVDANGAENSTGDAENTAGDAENTAGDTATDNEADAEAIDGDESGAEAMDGDESGAVAIDGDETVDETGDDEEDMPDPFDRESYINASEILAAMAEYDYIYTDDLDESIFNTGENQFFFLMNYKKEANDWEIIKIVQKL